MIAAAAAGSASASTIEAFWPPISHWAAAPRPASRSATVRPVRSDPVKLSARTSSLPTSAEPSSPSPCSTCSTPSGSSPSNRPAIRSAQTGECSDGFITQTLP